MPATRRKARQCARLLLCAFLMAWLSLAVWNGVKPLPPGVHVASLRARLAETDVEFLDDRARSDVAAGHSLEVFTQVLAAIDRAEQLVVLDFCRLTDDPTDLRVLAQHLLARKRARPNIKIVLITDPIQAKTNAQDSQYLIALELAGIIVVRARLDRLHDSNPLTAGLWRLTFAWWRNGVAAAGLASGVRDHRELIVADDGSGGWLCIVASGGPHDASRGDGGIGVLLRGGIAGDAMASELTIAAWSTDDDRLPPSPYVARTGLGSIDARFVSEGAIRAALLEAIGSAGSGDEIRLAGSRLGERGLIAAIVDAASRGAHVRVLLEPERETNQPVAAQILRAGGGRIEVRWYRPDGGQFDAKLLLVRQGADLWINVGSADFTRRGLDDLNLEAGVELRAPVRGAPARAAAAYFEQQWVRGTPYSHSADESALAYWRYRILEATGLSAF